MNKPSDNPRKALGKGLSALLPNRTSPEPPPAPSAEQPLETITKVPIDNIDPNPHQPRSIFQPERLNELAQSIESNGIIQPLVVRRSGTRYQLIAGERRWRAAKLAGLTQVPVVVQDFPDDRLLEITLIENIQREDLNPIEVAHAFERLARDANLSHEEIGKRTGKDRATVTNTLRLLRLPAPVQQLLSDRRLSMGHARAIVGLPTPELQAEIAEKTTAQGLSVRQVERLIAKMTETRDPKAPESDQPKIDPNVRAAIEELERALGTRVRIVEKSEQRGRFEIEYYSTDDRDRIYSLILGENNN
ncbi:MAG: ParB/RepB/Spo0J family partition protein [Acidobacteria bacterium]|nr:ParB/RepB/Spo0J family partition protein [Acidobacteriota bacterium]